MLSIYLRKVPEEQQSVVNQLVTENAPSGAKQALVVWRNAKRFCVLYWNEVRFIEMQAFSRY